MFQKPALFTLLLRIELDGTGSWLQPYLRLGTAFTPSLTVCNRATQTNPGRENR